MSDKTAVSEDPFVAKFCPACHGIISGVTTGSSIARCTCNSKQNKMNDMTTKDNATT